MLFYLAIAVGIIISLYFLIPKATNLHEILRLPYYNYKAQTARRDDMQMQKVFYGKHRQQHFLFCTSKDQNFDPKKVILYFHGGGWTFGNPMMFRCNAQFFVDQGFAFVLATYRRLPLYRARDMQQDAELALQKTLQILEEKGWQDKSIIFSGLSSGGHLAALLSYDRSNWSSLGFAKNRLAGIMLFGSPLDLRKMAWTPVTWRLSGNRNTANFNQVNPVHHVSFGDNIPLLLVHGTKDGLVNYKSSLSFVEKRGNRNLTFYTIEGGTHLEAGLWVFEEGELKKLVLNWLEKDQVNKLTS